MRPAVAFLDIWMPGTGGAELARRIRQEFSPSELMLVATTGLGRDAIDADAPFEHHVLKPLSPEEVSQLLNAARSAGKDA